MKQEIMAEGEGPQRSTVIPIRRLIALILGPATMLGLLIFPVPENLSPEAWNLVTVSAWMMIWWMTEAVPVPVTALLPIPLMPLLHISEQKAVSANYGDPLIFLFLGGFLIAAAMQRWGLHERIALHIVKMMGTGPESIIAGFMLATAFLSMWISNTATTVMMYAVGISIIEFLSGHLDDQANVRRFGIALLLGVAYSASIGGVGTLIGTPPNALLASFLSANYAIEIGFGTWMQMGIPLVIIMLPLTWLLLCKGIFSVRDVKLGGVAGLIEKKLKALGPMSKGERIVLVVFVCTVFFWICKKWVVALTGLPITDTSITLMSAILLFAWPASVERGHFTIEWASVKNVPWGVLLLFGGGLALASAFKSTGLAADIGRLVGDMGTVNIALVVLATISLVIFLTEITSNTATTATFLPILGGIAVGLGLNPMVLVVPATLAASMAFMMPVATAPNAIVFAYEEMHIADMMKAGFWLNLITIGLVYAAMFILAPIVLGITL
ncbi:MAG: DASS family sodium-coupled anion symporter [Nitrospirales bacterium]|nr:DASS family sodium-coupled anion symporter [Nitrospirales bacterium]